jgi:hypothetical protein
MASLLMWMRAVRDHRPKPGAGSARYPVLWGLALRMRPDGSGFASQQQIADDVETSDRTVRKHLTWAIDTGYLLRTRRGHRLGNGGVVASEYRLCQPEMGDRLTTISTGKETHLNRKANGSQPEAGDLPSESSPSESSTSAARAPDRDPPVPAANGGQAHKYEPNARRALATLISERSLPFTPEALLEAAYRVGAGDPWDGYLKVKAATAENFATARDPAAVLRHRLGLAP